MVVWRHTFTLLQGVRPPSPAEHADPPGIEGHKLGTASGLIPQSLFIRSLELEIQTSTPTASWKQGANHSASAISYSQSIIKRASSPFPYSKMAVHLQLEDPLEVEDKELLPQHHLCIIKRPFMKMHENHSLNSNQIKLCISQKSWKYQTCPVGSTQLCDESITSCWGRCWLHRVGASLHRLQQSQ